MWRLLGQMRDKDKLSSLKSTQGDEADDLYGRYQCLPQDTLTAIAESRIIIKSPLTIAICGGLDRLIPKKQPVVTTKLVRVASPLENRVLTRIWVKLDFGDRLKVVYHLLH
jgi:hypothetical protein